VSALEYRCGECGKADVRLWREYQTFLDHQTLRCVECAMANQMHNYGDRKGLPYIAADLVDGDQIGWLVPAVPKADGSFWGYTSVPDDGVEWWYAQPCAVKIGRRENGAAK
jgi:hypothetical protein